MTKEKAPAGQGEGKDQNPTKGTIVSKVSRKQRARNARPGTVAANRHVEIQDQIAKRETVHYSDDDPAPSYVSLDGVFTADELETMPVVIVNSTTTRATVWRGPDGAWYRRGAWLRIQPQKDGQGSTFKILLSKGANREDLEYAMQVVQRTRAGNLKPRWEKRGTDWASWADDRTFVYAFHSRAYEDPYTHGDRSPGVTACDEPACIRRWHEDGVTHVLDEVRRDLPDRRGQYSVSVTRSLDEDFWIVDVFTDEFFGTVNDTATFISDLQWMTEACRQANAARAEKVSA